MAAYAYYRIIPELRLVIEYFGGELTIEDVVNTKMKELEDNYDPNYNFIVDFRNAKNIFSEQELKGYIDFVSRNKEFIGDRKSAIISNSSLSLVTTSIYAMYGRKSLPMQIRIVQDLAEAMEWCEVDKDNFELLNNILTEYKSNSVGM